MANAVKLGRMLVQAGVVGEDGLARALDVVTRGSASLGRALESLGLASEADVASAVAVSLGLAGASDEDLVPEADAPVVPLDFCRQRRVLLLGLRGRAVRLAMVDPLDFGAIQDVEFRTGLTVTPVVATETMLERALDRLERAAREGRSFDSLSLAEPAGEAEAFAEGGDVVDLDRLSKDGNLPPVVRLVNVLLTDAARAGASDVHVEPQDDHVQVRYRLDGLLHDIMRIPRRLQDATISRLKILAGMDISDRRRPQDGRSRLKLDGRRIDLRLSTLPTQFGEKVVVRLLDGQASRLHLEVIGFAPDALAKFRNVIAQPQGMVLVTGPTGSGKTSTLHAALAAVASPEKNIITLEDPIEYRVPGLNQVQVNPRAGVTFASGLRSILRQDPNIVLVGEIRDHETADIALEAAQTGHLLLSTVHANDAASSVTRLLDLGVDPSLVSSSLLAVLVQRLVACRAPRASRRRRRIRRSWRRSAAPTSSRRTARGSRPRVARPATAPGARDGAPSTSSCSSPTRSAT